MTIDVSRQAWTMLYVASMRLSMLQTALVVLRRKHRSAHCMRPVARGGRQNQGVNLRGIVPNDARRQVEMYLREARGRQYLELEMPALR